LKINHKLFAIKVNSIRRFAVKRETRADAAFKKTHAKSYPKLSANNFADLGGMN
jgi:hypothetical protein